jgi:ABC-type Fe3+-hydroxamate transport system substrate-binding protein
VNGTGGPDGPGLRVVSLVPSLTETLVRWGCPPVACTRFCEQPSLPTVGGTKNPDVPAIVGLGPDLVLMCEEENRREDARDLAAAGVPTAALAIESVDDVAVGMEMLAGLVGSGSPRLVASVAAYRSEVEAAVADAPALDGLRVFVPIWKRPWMTLSTRTYGSSLLSRLGAVNVVGEADGAGSGDRYPEMSLEEAADLRPAVVLAPDEPYPFGERHVPVLREVAPVVLVDGQDLFWWGVRTPEAIRRLADRLSVING